MSIKCPLCTESSALITTLLHLHVHCINAHPNEFCTCPWCAVPFTSIRALKEHAKNCSAFDKNESREGEIHPLLVNGNQCLVCTGKFPSNEAAIAHYKEQHLHFSYICVECQQYFQQKSALDDHRATWHALPIETSVASNPTNREQTERNSTGNAFAPNVNVNGRIAKRRRTISGDAPRSVKLHFMKRFNRKHCLECDITFSSTSRIAQHFRIEHETEVFICNECNNGYLSEGAMQHHRRKCNENGAECAPSANTLSNIENNAPNPMPLKTDKRIHMRYFNEKRCIDCKERFATTKDIAEHFESMHGIKVLLCSICNKGHLSSLAMLNHRRTKHNVRTKADRTKGEKVNDGVTSMPSASLNEIKNEQKPFAKCDSTFFDLTLDD